MSNASFKKKSIVSNALLFAVSSVITAALLKSIDLSMFYIPIKADFSVVTLSDAIKIASEYAKNSAFLMLLIFLSGFTHFPFLVSSVVCVYRGICLGFAVSSLSNGTVFFLNNEYVLGLPRSVYILVFYFLSTALMLIFSSSAKSFSSYLKERSSFKENGAAARAFARYISIFLVMCGIVTIIDIIKCLMI